MNPCAPVAVPAAPVVHSAAVLAAWAAWRGLHPAWKAAVVAVAVSGPATVIVPACPGPPHFGQSYGPVFSGPAYEMGPLFVPSLFEMPLRDAPSRSVAVTAGEIPEEVDALPPSTASGGSPLIPAHTPAFTEIQPATLVDETPIPEPPSWLLMIGLGVAWFWIKGVRR